MFARDRYRIDAHRMHPVVQGNILDVQFLINLGGSHAFTLT